VTLWHQTQWQLGEDFDTQETLQEDGWTRQTLTQDYQAECLLAVQAPAGEVEDREEWRKLGWRTMKKMKMKNSLPYTYVPVLLGARGGL
jgi:hypothetical protein